MPAKSLKKGPKMGSKGQKKGKKTKKSAPQVQPMSDSDNIEPSQSLLDTGAMQAGSKVEEGEGEEASQKPAHAATVTLATQSDEDDDEEDGVPSRKKINVSEIMIKDQEQQLVEFFASNPLFYDQTLKEFKDWSKKDRLLAEVGADLGMTGGCTFAINRSSYMFATLWCINNIYYLFSNYMY